MQGLQGILQNSSLNIKTPVKRASTKVETEGTAHSENAELNSNQKSSEFK